MRLPFFYFINMLGLPCSKKGNKMSYILTPNGRKPMITESWELDEVGDTPAGKKALIRYVKKAKADQISDVDRQGKHYAGKSSKYQNRETGTNRALDRLAKEEVEKGGMGRMDEDQQIDELKGIKAPGEREKYVDKAKASVGGKIMKAGLKKMVGLGGPSDRDMDTIQKRVTGIARAGDRRTAADLAHMTGANMPNSKRRKMKEDVEVELDMDHFVEYVMENFPELTEMYIRENYDYEGS